MYDPIISQVNYDVEEYQRKINAIEKAKKDLNNWLGKPKYDVMLQCIDRWEKEILEIKKTFIPAMKELIIKVENNDHLNELKFLSNAP
ncbi:hypothetical protein [uncultured Lacinutrix sp.]|uniref:hypothetical protein n=1 Tax=uncultured Lacinutrix sp. TaxID=574032 RepID=UPI00261CD698|nr:hypothetical protein [uncultured Lacinutrix sp.]